MKVTFIVEALITMHTTVKAETLEAAVQEAAKRSVMSLCDHCGRKSGEVRWVTSGELDTDPLSSELVDLNIDGVSPNGVEKDVYYDQARELWGCH